MTLLWLWACVSPDGKPVESTPSESAGMDSVDSEPKEVPESGGETGSESAAETACEATPWHPDADRDGYGDVGTEVWACAAPEGHVADGTDCDDTDAAVYPGATETLDDGVDSDCSGYDECGELGVYEGYLVLGMYDDVSDIGEFCSSWSQIAGGLTVTSNEIASLTDFVCLCDLTGGLFLSDLDSLRSLNGLGGFSRLDELYVNRVTELTSLDGLSGLRMDTMERVYISEAYALEDIDVLSRVRELDEELLLVYTGAIPDLSAFGNLERAEYVSISEVPGLDATGMDRLRETDISFWITDTVNIGSFPALSQVGGAFTTFNVAAGGSPGAFPVLEEVGSVFWHGTAPDATHFGEFPMLRTVGGSLTLKDAPAVEDLSGFEALEWIGGDLILVECDALTDLSALSNLTYVGGCIDIECANLPAEEVDAFEAAIPFVGGVCLGWTYGGS